MLLIYTQKITPRIQYIFKVIFEEIMKVNYEITTSSERFINDTSAKINYSAKQFEKEIHIIPREILFETGIWEQEIAVENIGGIDMFFQTSPMGDFGFDVFAASFYLITRFEEYFPFAPDQHGRFKATDSLAYKNGFLKKPIVNTWINLLEKIIKQNYPDFKTGEKKYNFIPTIDVDVAYAYLYRGIFRTLGAIAKDFLKLNFYNNIKRIAVVLGRKSDPFDTYTLAHQIHYFHKLKWIIFFLVGKKSKFDRNLSPNNKGVQKLIKKLSEKLKVGIHPSYYSIEKPQFLEKEIVTLKKILNKPLKISRQHYLRLKFPDTYQNLIKNGIEEDYTLGYAETTGFRASICTPFTFYDLANEAITNLKIYPFSIMDCSLNQYMQLSPESATEEIKKIISEIKSVNGTLITLWHNESLGEQGIWCGWLNVYKNLVRIAAS